MCLIVNKNEIARTSKNNMLVYKFLGNDNRSPVEDFRYFKYKLNPSVELIPDYWDRISDCFEFGYHSRLKNSPYLKSHLFIIPANTKYYIGGENEYNIINGAISENIIYVGKNTWLNRLWVRLIYKTIDL